MYNFYGAINDIHYKKTVVLRFLLYSHIGVNGKVAGFITYCKVILCQLGFGSVKGHLITSEPALVAI